MNLSSKNSTIKTLPASHAGAACGPFAEAMVNALPTPALLVAPQGEVLLYNSAATALAVRQAAVHAVQTFAQFLEQADLPANLASRIHAGDTEALISTNRGEYLVCFSPLLCQGQNIGCLVEIRTETLDARQISLIKLKQRHQEFLRCIEISTDGFCIMAADTTVLYANPAYEKITMLKLNEVVGHTMRDLVRRGVFDKSVAEVILHSYKPASLTLNLATGKTLLVSGAPLFDEANQISRIVCCVRDVTELNRLQLELSASEVLKTRYEEELVGLKKSALHDTYLIFRSPAMQHIVELILRLRLVDSTILLTSESGAGKEVCADFIQKNSLRTEQPFLKINCGAIPEQLLESELFGYTPGAFTGAERTGKAGLFEAANHGTLLLDEVGEMPKPLQVKLLRVLQDKKVRRIGSTSSVTVDVRLIASTNRNLAKMVESGEFREDLFYRLNVVPITIPPLRERKEDIVPMVQAFLERFGERYNTHKVLHPSVIPILIAYHWQIGRAHV